jgi:hypothetical protein
MKDVRLRRWTLLDAHEVVMRYASEVFHKLEPASLAASVAYWRHFWLSLAPNFIKGLVDAAQAPEDWVIQVASIKMEQADRY